MRTVFVVIVMLSLNCGCASWFQFKQRDGTIECDSRYYGTAKECQAAAKRLIESCGVKLPSKAPYCRIDVQKGVKYYVIDGKKVWYMEADGLCGGYSKGRYIRMACDPVTGDITPWVLTHEFGHHWLTSIGNTMGHDPRFKKVFKLWYDAK